MGSADYPRPRQLEHPLRPLRKEDEGDAGPYHLGRAQDVYCLLGASPTSRLRPGDRGAPDLSFVRNPPDIFVNTVEYLVGEDNDPDFVPGPDIQHILAESGVFIITERF